jgi:hypothetical protein
MAQTIRSIVVTLSLLVLGGVAPAPAAVPAPEQLPANVVAERLKEEALGERLNAVWIEGQAALMGIDVSARQVARELARIKEANFKSEREYHAFLRASRFTQRDVDERVRLQLLANRIQERVARQATGSVQAAFKRFVEEFRKRWKARTVCAPRFVTSLCSNSPPSGRASA